MLPDGTYDAFVLDAAEVDGGRPGDARVELTITSGPHKGDVIAVLGQVGAGSPFDLLGIPATLVVEAGVPRLQLD